MEPVSDVSDENIKPKRDLPPVDRVSLGKEESEKLDRWLKQVQEAFGGVIKLNKADLVNFLVREHNESLSTRELKSLRAFHFDEVKFATWALSRLKEAKKNGVDLKYEDILRLQLSNDKVKSDDVSEKPRKLRAPKRVKGDDELEPPITE
jgi:predicted RNA-binding protein